MILNLTTNTVISKQEKACKTIFSQSLGLMFRRRQNLLMLFPSERKVHLHTFFVFYPLTIVLLDKNYTVIEVKENLLPFRFWNSQKKGKYLLELALSGITKTRHSSPIHGLKPVVLRALVNRRVFGIENCALKCGVLDPAQFSIIPRTGDKIKMKPEE